MSVAAAALLSGQLLFSVHCASCHGAALQGTANGPSLQRASAASVDFMLKTGRMPAAVASTPQLGGRPQFDDAQMQAIVAYVVLRGGGSAQIPQLASGEARRGRALFAENCAQCHGVTASGASVGSDNVAPSLHATADEQILEAVRTGPGVMPRFGVDVLSTQDADDIVAFLGTMRTPDDAGGWSLGNVGPVAEGLVAWLFGLGLLVWFIRSIGAVR